MRGGRPLVAWRAANAAKSLNIRGTHLRDLDQERIESGV
jgi:hypothetical protein